jgi:FkbM family methyltransferase
MNRMLDGMKNVGREINLAFRVLADAQSKLTYARDLILFHAMVAGVKDPSDSTRRLKFKAGSIVQYALNEGDVQSVREVMVEEIYRPPAYMKPSVVVDLGGNIGLASVFYHQEYKCPRVICVEPVARNVRMIRENLRLNGVEAMVLQAAVSSVAGTVRFRSDTRSNQGRVSEDGELVAPCVTMSEILGVTPNNWIDLLKIDIEGHEETLLTENNSWLQRVGAILIEFHPWLVDYPGSIELLKAHGFRYFPPAHTRKADAWQGSTDLFVRQA